MGTLALGEQKRPDYTPEEVALITRLKVFVKMRWFAIGGVIVATIVASEIFGIKFPTLPVYIICAAIGLYNVLLFRQARSLERTKPESIIQKFRTYGNIHFFLDIYALTGLIYFTGGVESPLIVYFVVDIVAASISIYYRVVYSLVATAVIMMSVLAGLEYSGVIPHVSPQGFSSPMLYQHGSYVIAVLVALAALLFATAYMVTAISGELRKRQRQVVELRERHIEQKTGELEKATKEISKLEEQRKRFLMFLGVAAHDLKAPLTAIQGYLWVMLGGYAGELSEKQKGMLERSTLRITELLTLISDLLDIPRIETGQMKQEIKEVSLSDIVKCCCDDQRNLAEKKGLCLNLEMPQSLPQVRGSEARLKQVLNNLLDNSIRYTPSGSITVKVSEQKGDIQVEVMDTGIGIPHEDTSRVFNDFFRGSNVDIKGTGLGLSISKRIVEAHGGNIWFQSPAPETNSGTKFAFTLPKM